MMTPPVPWIGVKTIRSDLALRRTRAGSRIERLEPLHVGLVDLVAER